MRLGAMAGNRRRSGGLLNLIANGTFADASGWSNLGFSGKSVAGGKLVFAATPAFDGAYYTCALVGGSYYELTWTISGYSSGTPAPYLTTGGTNRTGTTRSANGTYVERLLANAGNTQFAILPGVTGTFQVDDVSLIGPYTTATVGGA